MDYNLDKELPNQKEKLWKVLVHWFRGIRMYADIEMSNKNNDYLHTELGDNRILGNFLSLYKKHKLGFLTSKLSANDVREIRGRLLLSIMNDFCNIKKRIFKLEVINNSFSEFKNFSKEFSKSLSITLGKRFLLEIKSNQYEGEIYLDNTKVKVQKNTKKYIDHAFFEEKNHNVECTPIVQEKRKVIIEPIGPTLKLSLDRKLIDYCRKKITERKIKDLSFLTNEELKILKDKKGKVININNDLYKMKENNDVYAITFLSEVSDTVTKDDQANSNILDTFDIYKNVDIPKPFNQEEKVLDKERNEEIFSCKEKILNYMKTKMSEDRRRILSLLASQQYGLKEISELLKMDYGKVRKERSFAKKELREAFPECYKILEKKG